MALLGTFTHVPPDEGRFPTHGDVTEAKRRGTGGEYAPPEQVDSSMRHKTTMKLRFLVLRYLVAASRRYARSSLKNCVKILIGRKTFFHDDDLIFRQYVLQLIGLRPIQRLTCTGLLCEGPGSQAITVMHAINFARSSGLTYLHTPFSVIKHADRPQQEWANAWETLFNFGAGEKACDVQRHEVVNYCFGFDSLPLCFGWLNRRDDLADRFKAIIPEFRRKYYLDKSPRTTEEVTVAVHIRRGYDVSANDSLFTSTDSILRTITLVKAVLDTHSVQYRISVYSEGNSADFAEICIPGVELSKYRVGHYSDGSSDDITEVSLPSVESFLDIDAIRAMRELIEADALIMSKSSFSYCAGLISDGIKIFEQLREPMDDWLLCSQDGSFDCAAFEHQLFLLLQAKGATNKSIGHSIDAITIPNIK